MARTAWRAEFAHAPAPALVFLDESAAKTNMTRLRGRAPRGTRVPDRAPAGPWGTTACMTIQEATDTEVFRALVQQVLLQTLKPGDGIVFDDGHPDAKEEGGRVFSVEPQGKIVFLTFKDGAMDFQRVKRGVSMVIRLAPWRIG